MIYLDNASTTPMLPCAVKTYEKYAAHNFYNPSAIYKPSVQVKQDIIQAKQIIKKSLGATTGEIIFTSSATEANNLALIGSLRSNFKKIIISSAEHASIYNVAKHLEEKGLNVDFCPLQDNGQIDYEALENMIDGNTNLISIVHVNNETGAINDIKRISEIRNRKCKNAILHVDGVQAFSKIKINLSYFGADLYTISSHKIFGPKGIACLYVKNKNLIKPMIFGGGQEDNIRSGTENVPAIMSFKTAVEKIGDIQQNYEYVRQLRDLFIENLKDLSVKINTSDNNSPYILSLCFKGVNGETLVHMLEEQEIYISTGSACSSHNSGNRVLSAMGVSNMDVKGCVRISFSKYNTKDEIITASKTLADCYCKLLDKLR